MIISSKVTFIDVMSAEIDTIIRLFRGGHNVAGLEVSIDGNYAFVTNSIGKFRAPSVERGWLHTNNIAVIDVKKREYLTDVCLDIVSKGMANPWGISCTKDSSFIVVAHAGANELSVIDYKEFIDTVMLAVEEGRNLQHTFDALTEMRQRIVVQAQNPRAVTTIGKKAYTAGYFSDVEQYIYIYDLDLSTTQASGKILLDQPKSVTGFRKGEALFYDASLCFQEWQSCHSCHTLTRSDGMFWTINGTAVWAPKNSKAMLYSWWTAPNSWAGRWKEKGSAVRAGIELKLYRVADDSWALPLDTFMMYMAPVASPHLQAGKLSEAAQRGKILFFGERAGCIRCHPKPPFTSKSVTTITIPDPYDASTGWDAPTLAEVWRSGPYGHLGGIWSVQEMVENYMVQDISPPLSVSEIDELVEYVLSL